MKWSAHPRRIDPISRSTKPRRWCNGPIPDAHGTQSVCDDGAVDPIAVLDHVSGGAIPRKSLGDLTRNPFGRGICCDVDPDEVSAVQPDDDEGIEQVETDSCNNEQVHGGNVRRMVTQRFAIPDWAAPVVSPCTWRRLIGRRETQA